MKNKNKIVLLVSMCIFFKNVLHPMIPAARGIDWAKSWCWLDASLHIMVEMQPLTSFLEEQLDKNSLVENSWQKELALLLRKIRGIKRKSGTPILGSKISKTGQIRKTYKQEAIKTTKTDKFYNAFFKIPNLKDQGLEQNQDNDPAPFFNYMLCQFSQITQFDILIYPTNSAQEKPSITKTFNIYSALNNNHIQELRESVEQHKIPDWLNFNMDDRPKEINVPSNLVLPFCKPYEASYKKFYDLYGIIFYKPRIHYTSLVKQADGDWYYYDGLAGIREKISPEMLAEILKNNCYKKDFYGKLFFYRPMLISSLNDLQKQLSKLQEKLKTLANKLELLKIALRK